MKLQHILLVEDSLFWKKIIRKSLNAITYNVKIKCVKSAEEAKELIQANQKFDLIISDHYLEQSETGLDLWNECQSQNSHVPFILTSGISKSKITTESSALRYMPSFLPKPFSTTELTQMVQKIELKSNLEHTKPSTKLKDAAILLTLGVAIIFMLNQVSKIPSSTQFKSMIQSVIGQKDMKVSAK